jgi:peptide chain release factor 3
MQYGALPQFSPEHFARLRCPDTARRKQFERGLKQLLEEGAIQVFTDPQAARREPILAAVGALQFDVVRFRLEREYNTPTEIEMLPYNLARWVETDDEGMKDLGGVFRIRLVRDQRGDFVALFQSDWDVRYIQQKFPRVSFTEVRPVGGSATASEMIAR